MPDRILVPTFALGHSGKPRVPLLAEHREYLLKPLKFKVLLGSAPHAGKIKQNYYLIGSTSVRAADNKGGFCKGRWRFRWHFSGFSKAILGVQDPGRDAGMALWQLNARQVPPRLPNPATYGLFTSMSPFRRPGFAGSVLVVDAGLDRLRRR